MRYYYLTASLPGIEMDEPLPFPIAKFRGMCVSVLAEPDLNEMDCVLEGRFADGQSPFCKAYTAAETQLRNALASIRAGRRKMDGRAWIKDHTGFSVAIEKTVTDACAKSNPLERERELDRHRWKLLQDLALEDSFGLPAVLSFAARLRLAERWIESTDEKGQARLSERLDDLTDRESLKNVIRK